MVQQYVRDRFLPPDVDASLLGPAGKIDGDAARRIGVGALVQLAVRRRDDRRRPASLSDRLREVANHIGDTADLAARQGAVLCGDKDDVRCIDRALPKVDGT